MSCDDYLMNLPDETDPDHEPEPDVDDLYYEYEPVDEDDLYYEYEPVDEDFESYERRESKFDPEFDSELGYNSPTHRSGTQTQLTGTVSRLTKGDAYVCWEDSHLITDVPPNLILVIPKQNLRGECQEGSLGYLTRTDIGDHYADYASVSQSAGDQWIFYSQGSPDINETAPESLTNPDSWPQAPFRLVTAPDNPFSGTRLCPVPAVECDNPGRLLISKIIRGVS